MNADTILDTHGNKRPVRPPHEPGCLCPQDAGAEDILDPLCPVPSHRAAFDAWRASAGPARPAAAAPRAVLFRETQREWGM